MKVELYYDGSLGGDNELMDAMQMNGVTFALMGPAGVQTLCPMYNFFDLPACSRQPMQPSIPGQ